MQNNNSFTDKRFVFTLKRNPLTINTKPTSTGQIDRFQTFVKFTHI